MAEILPEHLPEIEVIFQESTMDGLLSLTVRRLHDPLTEQMKSRGVAAMGILRIENNVSKITELEQRIGLSYRAIYGRGLSRAEINDWRDLLDLFHPEGNRDYDDD